MRLCMRALFIAPLLLLAACESEPENIQAKSENLSRQLEAKAGEIEAEAANGVAARTAPLDKEADLLLNRMDAGAAGNAAEAAGNAH
jgi:hypothetical protein